MNPNDENAHEDVGRRLRQTGVVPAPANVRAAVMRQVREEAAARAGSREGWWRRRVGPIVAGVAVAAALLVAAALIGNGGGSSGGGSSAAHEAAGGAAATTRAPGENLLTPAQAEQLPHSRVYRVPESVAQSLLGQQLPRKRTGVILVPVPGQRFDVLKTLLKTAASEPPVKERHLRIKLVRVK